MVVTLGQPYNVGEKPTVILYTTIISRHAGTPNKQKQCSTQLYRVVIIYDISTIEPYSNNRGL